MSELIHLDHRSLMQFSFLMMLSVTFIISGYILTGNKTKNILLLNLGNLIYTLFFFTVSVDIAIPLRRLPEVVAFLDLSAVILWIASLRETINEKNPLKAYGVLSVVHLLVIAFLARILNTVSLLRMTTSLTIAILLLVSTFRIMGSRSFIKLDSYKFTSFTLLLYIIFKIIMSGYRLFTYNFESTIISIETSINIFTFISLVFAVWINFAIMFLNDDVKRKEVERYSQHDYLTQLPNRKLLSKKFMEFTYQAEVFDQNFALAIIDIDDFKKINDKFGHNIGDEVLVDFAKHMTRVMRASDFICRYGGEEFLVLLSTNTPEEMAIIIDRILDEIRLQSFSSVEVMLTVSIGAIFISHNLSHIEFNELASVADDNLYQAKGLGKNRVVYSIVEQKNRTGTLK